jgi:hypothetical protein
VAEVLLTFKRAEEKYGPKVVTWRTWAYKRLIPVVRLGRRVYLTESAIRAMVVRNTIPAREQ